MKIPFKIRQFDPFKKFPRYIVIHDVSCMNTQIDKLRLDSPKFQTNILRNQQYIIDMQPDLNYHYIVEKIGEDYEVILGRPFATYCEYDDIKNPYNHSIHICVMGNYNFDIPAKRLYQKIVYSIISPLIRQFKFPKDRIVLHSEISTDQSVVCPGTFFDKNILMNHVKSMLITG